MKKKNAKKDLDLTLEEIARQIRPEARTSNSGGSPTFATSVSPNCACSC